MSEPLNAEEIAALRAFSTPTVCNAVETFNVRPWSEGFMDGTIGCRFPELGPMVGYAVTAKMRAASKPQTQVPFGEVWDEFEKTQRPWVVVVEDLDRPKPVGSFWGEVNASVYKRLGAVGCVTNGGVRDLGDVRPHGFHFFSSCLLVSHAYLHVVEAGTPVSVGGLTVRPGDLLHGDEARRDVRAARDRARLARGVRQDRGGGACADRLCGVSGVDGGGAAGMYGRVD
ncbi:MAG: RraA family protein [Dehalococcoidia bacterium]